MEETADENGQPEAARSIQQAEIDELNQKAWDMRHTQAEEAFRLSYLALERSTSGRFAQEPYLTGQSASLVTLAYLNHDSGQLDLALNQIMDSLAILENLPPSPVMIQALSVINWIYYFIGDFSTAIDFGLRGLKLARELDLKLEQAACLDGLAMVYGAAGDLEHAIERQEEALQITRECGNPMLEAGILNNMALNLMEAGDLPRALETCLAALKIDQEAHGETEEIIPTLDTLGQIYQRMGDYANSQATFHKGLRMARQGERSLDEAYCLMGLGASLLAQDQVTGAEEAITGALQLSERLGTRPVQVQCYQLLSEIYERQGDLEQALQFYKDFFRLNQEVNNESSNKRMDILKVVFQMETARRDSEIYRLRTVALQHEIDERRRAETELKRLATLDPLTNLFNRRHFFYLANLQFEYAEQHTLPLSAMMIDTDNFKLINDRFGHAIGDRVICQIANVIRENLRESDIIGRYGGDEFCVVLPHTTPEQARQVSERLCEQICNHTFHIEAGDIQITLSVGLAHYDTTGHSPANVDQLLVSADRALYAAKTGGRNRVEFR